MKSNMKKLFFPLFLLVWLTGCQDAVQQLSGTYSYKISGTVNVDSVGESRINEIGSMELIHLTADSALLAFNALNGPAYTTSATIRDKQIHLYPYQRTLESGLRTKTVTADGEGEIYDQTIVIRLSYRGDSTVNQLTLLCQKN